MLYLGSLKKKAVSYWRNTKGGKTNWKLKSMQTNYNFGMQP